MKLLEELFQTLTKDELTQLRRTFGVPNASQCNKSELAQRVGSYMLDHMESHLKRLDHERFDLLVKVMETENGSVSAGEMTEEYDSLYFRQYGFLFFCEDRVVMPQEIREKLQGMDLSAMQPVLDRNTEWIRLTQGLLFYYGVMSMEELKKQVEAYTGQAVEEQEYRQVIAELEGYDYSVTAAPNGFAFYLVEDAARVAQEHLARGELAYYSFSKEQILAASEGGFVDRHEGHLRFVEYLQKNWDMDRQEADAITADVADGFRRGITPTDLVAGLQEELEFRDQAQLQELIEALMNLTNHTRLWDLKGYTPEELFGGAAAQTAAAKREPITRGEKIGRNEPCPCGSGKKFKKCCG